MSPVYRWIGRTYGFLLIVFHAYILILFIRALYYLLWVWFIYNYSIVFKFCTAHLADDTVCDQRVDFGITSWWPGSTAAQFRQCYRNCRNRRGSMVIVWRHANTHYDVVLTIALATFLWTRAYFERVCSMVNYQARFMALWPAIVQGNVNNLKLFS